MPNDHLVTEAAVALRKLITAPNFGALDKAHNISDDIINLSLKFRMKRFVDERVRLNRMNIACFIEEGAESDPERDAIWFAGKAYSYKVLDEITDRFARWLVKKGVTPKSYVAILMHNSANFLFTFLGIMRLGAVPCLIDYNLRDRGLKHILTLHNLAGVISEPESVSYLKPIVEELEIRPPFVAAWNDNSESLPSGVISLTLTGVLAETEALPSISPYPVTMSDAGYVLHTSGTTGLPKAVQWKIGQVLGTTASFINFDMTKDDRSLLVTPMYHGAAIFAGVLTSLGCGATMIVYREFSASKFWQRAIDSDATRCVYVGELTRYLLNQPPSPLDSKHRVKKWSGLGLRPELWVEFKKRFGITAINEWYGQTEGAPNHNTLNRQYTAVDGSEPGAGLVGHLGTLALEISQVKFFRHDADTGKPLVNAKGHLEEASVGEPGEIAVRVEEWAGYYKNPTATASKLFKDALGPGTGTYYLTGDVLIRDADNGVRFSDRTGDTFRWKGENVSTTAVEEVCTSVKGVSHANCYGVKVPNLEDGRAGMVALVVEPSKFSLDELAKYVVSQLPSYAYPLWVRITSPESIAVSAIFKLQKVALGAAAMDPSKCSGDQLYMFDQQTKSYNPFGEKEYAKLVSTKAKI